MFLVLSCKSTHPFLSNTTMVIDSINGTVMLDPFRHLETETLDSNYKEWLMLESQFVTKNLDHKLDRVFSGTVDSNYVGYFNLNINKNGNYWYLQDKWIPKTSEKDTISWYLATCLFLKEAISGDEKCIINPTELDTTYSINYYNHSWDNNYVAVGLSEEGQEIVKIKVFDIKNDHFLAGEATNSFPTQLGGVEWLPDNSGFLYTYFPIVDHTKEGYLLNSKIKTYNIKEGRITDSDLFSISSLDSTLFEAQSFPITDISGENNNYVIGSVASVSSFRNTYISETKDFIGSSPKWKLLWTSDDMITSHKVTSSHIYFKSARENPNYILYRTKIDDYDIKQAEIIFDPEESVLSDYAITSNGIFIVSSKNSVSSELYRIKDEKVEQIQLPFPVAQIDLHSLSSQEPELWLDFQGWTTEDSRYFYDSRSKEFSEVDLSQGRRRIHDVDVIETEINGHDNVQIPVSIIKPKHIIGDLHKNILLTAYGAFGISMVPEYDDLVKKWLASGGTYVVAHVRGGGEKGEQWHLDGMKQTKENSWLDIISVSEYLIENDLTSKKKICLLGQSAGAIATGMAITERPDIFKAGAFIVGAINPSRNEFGRQGKNITQEFGSIYNPKESTYLLQMDPYLNIKESQNYPSMYIYAGLDDKRLSVWQSTKFAARLKSRKAQKSLILLDVGESGHEFGSDYESYEKGINKVISFFLWQLGHPDFQ